MKRYSKNRAKAKLGIPIARGAIFAPILIRDFSIRDSQYEMHQTKLFVMRWSNRDQRFNEPNKWGLWVSIDFITGFPYASQFYINAHVWTSLEAAKQFQSGYPYLDIIEITTTLEAVG